MAIVTLLVGAATSLPASVAGQTDVRYESDHWGRSVLRIGQNYVLRADAIVGEAVVVFGDATIEGRVDRDVVVVLGKAQLASTAVIEGSLVVVGGSANTTSGALIGRDLFVLGGAFDAPAGFSPGGQHIVIGPAALGGRLESIVPWITRGLLWGRPIVPDLPWVWRVVGVVLPRVPDPESLPSRACARVRRNTRRQAADRIRRRPSGPAPYRTGVPASGGIGDRTGRRAVRALRAVRGRDHRQGWCRAMDRHGDRAPGIAGKPAAIVPILRDRLCADLPGLYGPTTRVRRVDPGRSVRPRRRVFGVHFRVQTRESCLPRAGQRPRPSAASVTAVRRCVVAERRASCACLHSVCGANGAVCGIGSRVVSARGISGSPRRPSCSTSSWW